MAVAALGAAAGAGVASALFCLLVAAGAGHPAIIFAVDVALLAAGVVLWRRGHGASAQVGPVQAPPRFRWNWLLALCLGAGLLLVGVTWIDTARTNPYGEWDAWAIWNLRAKFLAGPGEAWKHAVSRLLEHSHPEYPLLTSGFIARVWKCSGGTPEWVPIATGILWAACVPALLIGALARLRGTTSALLAGLVFLAGTLFLVEAPSQYADVPLSLYYLGTLVLVGLASAARAPARLLALAGVFTSLAAWTKNEGIVFAALALGGFLMVEWRAAGWEEALRRWRWLALGAAPVLLMVAGLKLFVIRGLEPALAQPLGEVAHKLVQFDRYVMIAKALGAEALRLGLGLGHPLILLSILAVTLGVVRPRQWSRPATFAALTLGLTLAAYCGVYLITPQDLKWQLDTTTGRLYAQLWPGFLWAAFLVLKRAEDRLPPAATPRRARPAASQRRERGRKP